MQFDKALSVIKSGGDVPAAFQAAFLHSVQNLCEHRNADPLQRFAEAVLVAKVRPKGASMKQLREVIGAVSEAVTIKTERNGAVTVTIPKGTNFPAFSEVQSALNGAEWWTVGQEGEEAEAKRTKTDEEKLTTAFDAYVKKHGVAGFESVFRAYSAGLLHMAVSGLVIGR